MKGTAEGGNTNLDRSHLGDRGELWFAASLPCGWVWQPPRRDFGKDGLIVIQDQTNLHNLEFSVQIKTTESPRVRGGYLILSGVSRSSIKYWFASPIPTLIVAIDFNSLSAWYAWHLDLFKSPMEVFGAESKTMTLRIPCANKLDDAGWVAVRKDIYDHFKSLERALSSDAVVPHLERTIYSVARIAGNLIRLGRREPPKPPLTQDDGMDLLIEQMQIRDLINYIGSFQSYVAPRTDAFKQIEFALSSIKELARRTHPLIDNLPPAGHDIPAETELAFAPKLLLETREQLILAAVDLIRILTSPQPSRGEF